MRNAVKGSDPPSDEAGQDQVRSEPIDFSRFEGIGVPPRAAWLVSAVLYGLMVVLFNVLAFTSSIVPRSIVYLTPTGVVMSVVCFLGAKYWTNAWWGGHLRVSCGILIVCAGTIIMGDAHSATVLIMLYPLLICAYLYDARRSLPYIVFGVAWIVVTLLLINDPAAHGIVTGATISAILAAIVFSQRELRSIVQINRELSVTDPLTGAANLRLLRKELDDAIADEREVGETLFGIDLDDFKLVNDQFSHTRGDEVLKAVADEIQDVLEATDLLARRGGDEFSVLVTTSQNRDLNAFRDDLDRAIKRARGRTCPEVSRRASIVFVARLRGESAEQLLERCDLALHEAKLDAHPERRTAEKTGEVIPIERLTRRRRDDQTADHGLNGPDGMIANEVRMARSLRHAMGNASAWHIIAVMCFAVTAAIIGALATSTGGEIGSTMLILATIGLTIQGGVSMYAARRDAPARFMHLQLVVMIALITVVEWQAGPERAVLSDLYLAAIVGSAFALEAKRMLPYLAASLVLFSVTLVAADYPYATARISITAVMTLSMVGLLAKARRVTREFTHNAVELSAVDALTGVANLRGMRRGVGAAINHCTATGERLALISVDLDEFKLVNDLHSHTLGDRVLVAVAAAMRGVVRNTDLVVRRGGDEFAIVCRVVDEREAILLAARVAETICDTRRKLVADVTPTASVGHVLWMPGESVDTFLSRADEELHVAKLQTHERLGADLFSVPALGHN